MEWVEALLGFGIVAVAVTLLGLILKERKPKKKPLQTQSVPIPEIPQTTGKYEMMLARQFPDFNVDAAKRGAQQALLIAMNNIGASRENTPAIRDNPFANLVNTRIRENAMKMRVEKFADVQFRQCEIVSFRHHPEGGSIVLIHFSLRYRHWLEHPDGRIMKGSPAVQVPAV